jgi:hypothetical protein
MSAAALALAAAASVHATMIVSKSFTDLCAEADQIFSATVADVRSRPVDAEHGHLETLVKFSHVEPILGTATPSVTLRFAGGVLDGVREEFVGVPRFTVGERVVLFARDGHQLSPIVGLSQGCFRVIDSDAGATVVASDGRPIAALEDLGRSADGGQATSTGPMQLDRFLDAVRKELEAQGRSQ